ncbi:MAG: sigma-E factor regulatory protein RseB [Serratia sp. (in: enterobacteria)]|uniref:sigma-E factor regulatory protein RseB n=1 Tax=Serratia sp. (in: enterobacteria) TaxID=616 RepID=UPI003F38E488
MKQIWFSVCLLTGSLLNANIASAQEPASGALLQQMSSASRSLNYELAYISISKQGIESLRYRHAVIDQLPLGQLLHMDGPRREVLQRGGGISYFEPGLEPFTLSGDHIVDALPAIVFADFNYLAKYYDFISVGRTRISDRACDVYRVVARDGSRYSYVVWMDMETKLPLRVDLLDRDGETLEQYRVISVVVGDQVKTVMQPLLKANLPPLLTLPAAEDVKLAWNAGWLPAGVNEVARNRRKLPNVAVPVESRLYSDGLFSFSVNISPSGSNASQQFYRQGRRTIQTEIRNGNEITVVGELPPSTAKRIADSITFKVAPQ